MQNDILDTLRDIGYKGEILEEGYLDKALEGGPKSVPYTRLVEWLSNEIKKLCKLEEKVNAISTPEDSSAFLLELSSFLKELGCSYSSLLEGHLNDRLNDRNDRLLLLDYLITELQAARMIKINKPELDKPLQLVLNESSTASDLKAICIALKFPKPPSNITASMLFGKLENKLKEVITSVPSELFSKPLFNGQLSDKQWTHLEEISKELSKEYRLRREMLIKRVDVTVQSFQWSDSAKKRQDEILQIYQHHRQKMNAQSNVNLADLLAAREDLAIMEKTSSSSVRKNTKSSINSVIIGRVPDRGGRPQDQQPPPPEMPSWQQRQGGQSGSGPRGGGSGRGGRVQGGWNQGQNNDSSGNYGGNNKGYQSFGKGGGGGYQGGGNRGGGGGYREDRGHQGGGYRDDRGQQGGGYRDDRGQQGGGYRDDRGQQGGGYKDDRGYQGGGGYRGRGGRGGRGGYQHR